MVAHDTTDSHCHPAALVGRWCVFDFSQPPRKLGPLLRSKVGHEGEDAVDASGWGGHRGEPAKRGETGKPGKRALSRRRGAGELVPVAVAVFDEGNASDVAKVHRCHS